MLAVVQAVAVEVEGQTPAFDIDLYLTGFTRFVEAPQREDFQGGVSQAWQTSRAVRAGIGVRLCKVILILGSGFWSIVTRHAGVISPDTDFRRHGHADSQLRRRGLIGSMRMRTGKRWTIFVKLPVALCGATAE